MTTQTPVIRDETGRPVQAEGAFLVDANGAPLGSASNPLATPDAFRGEVAMTPGTPYSAARSLKVVCTAAGNVAVTYADGSTGAWPVQIGVNTLPISVTTVLSGVSTTATATYFNLV